MTLNASKCYGGKGIGLLYKRERIALLPTVQGGGQERGLRSGTENVPAAYAFGIALKETQELRDTESARLSLLRDMTVRMLKHSILDIVFYGAFDSSHEEEVADEKRESLALRTRVMRRLPNNINCRIPGISSEEMILRLDARGFAVSHKSSCASMETDGSYVLQALGATEAEAKENIRISMGRSTTESDMKKLVEAMKEISEKYRNK